MTYFEKMAFKVKKTLFPYGYKCFEMKYFWKIFNKKFKIMIQWFLKIFLNLKKEYFENKHKINCHLMKWEWLVIACVDPPLKLLGL